MKRGVLFLVFFLLLTSSQTMSQKTIDANDFVKTLKKSTDIMVNDVTSPVAASRYYAYISMAAYEMLSLCEPNRFPSFKGKINGYNGIPTSVAKPSEVDRDLAVVLTLMRSTEMLLPSGYMMKKEIDSLRLHSKHEKGGTAVFDSTLRWVNRFVPGFVQHARGDGFLRLNNLSRYTPLKGDGYWQPTPPGFLSAIEPHWNKLRTFVLDSAAQFKVARPAAYSSSKNAAFYRLTKEVYDIKQKATQEQIDIANFWDCNPYAVQQIGHVEFGLKKISPGGHWMGIAGIACLQSKFDLAKTTLVHAILGITLADAFIACWDEKYRSHRIRPEHVIRRLIDQSWKPILQTPPFPEYVSGHSVASHAASQVLTRMIGDGFSFSDDTEVEFGLPTRTFPSFHSAAKEAAISRLYGGIHYKDAIEQGEILGRNVGQHALHRLNSHFALFH